VAGTITLDDPEVIRVIEGMGCPVRRGRVGLSALDRAMRGGRLTQGLLAATERWIGMAIVTKPEERAQRQRAWAALYDGWREAIRQPMATGPIDPDLVARLDEWLAAAARRIKGQWRKRPATIDRSVRRAIEAARRAPGLGLTAELVALPVFAQQVAGHPHALDAGRTAGRLAMAALRARFRESLGHITGSGAEARAAILDAAGLSMDGVSSRVVTFGLTGTHPLFAAAASMREPLTLTALNLEHVEIVIAPTGVVYVVENPAVFTHMVRALVNDTPPADRQGTSLVCTSGQFGVTAAMLLDRLVQRGAMLWYSGDFDAPGVFIFDRVWKRYPARCVPWRMTVEDYQRARRWRDTKGEQQDSNAAGRGDGVEWPVMRPRLLEEIGRGGPAYQEGLVQFLIADIKRHSVEPAR